MPVRRVVEEVAEVVVADEAGVGFAVVGSSAAFVTAGPTAVPSGVRGGAAGSSS
ncbi:hypothetical protein WCD74_17865 [Actinomycetospora sp. OC33-EN08]|uniref:Uncharacterized protein n=1 Tax=Actinomycetospora aurantiaca TaxID=3129233 RepID=A0ABU8MQP9_9PSEU